MTRSASSTVVYRALIGDYETLREEPVSETSNAEFICFTDDPDLRSDTWRLVLVEPLWPHDAVRSARYLKIMGHPLLSEYERSFWVDNKVELLASPDGIVSDWLSEHDIAVPLHSYRLSVWAEAKAILDQGLDDSSRVYEQLQHYAQDAQSVLDRPPHWTGLMARRHTPAMAEAMTTWWHHVLRYSRRDQLSFDVAMARHHVPVRSIDLDNHSSQLHGWPRSEVRGAGHDRGHFRSSLIAPAAEVGRVQQELDWTTKEWAKTVSVRDAQLTDQERRLAALQQEVATLRESTRQLAAQRAALKTKQAKLTQRLQRRRARLEERNATLARQRTKLDQQTQQLAALRERLRDAEAAGRSPWSRLRRP